MAYRVLACRCLISSLYFRLWNSLRRSNCGSKGRLRQCGERDMRRPAHGMRRSQHAVHTHIHVAERELGLVPVYVGVVCVLGASSGVHHCQLKSGTTHARGTTHASLPAQVRHNTRTRRQCGQGRSSQSAGRAGLPQGRCRYFAVTSSRLWLEAPGPPSAADLRPHTVTQHARTRSPTQRACCRAEGGWERQAAGG